MLFTCAPGCADPSHRHGSDRGAAQRAAATTARPRASASKSVGTVARDRRGRAVVVDIHCHYLNTDVAAKAAPLQPALHDPTSIFANDLTRATNKKQMQERAPQLSSLAQRLKDMDRMGVDIQAVCPAPFQYYYFAEPDVGAALARDINDGIAQLVAAQPDRLVGLGSLPLQDAQLAIREMERGMRDLGLRGFEINTNVNGKNLTDPALGLEKFFARANELGAVLFLHPMGFTEADRLTHHYFNNIIGNPLDTTIAVSHLIFDGVVARHPKIRFIAAHGGGFIANYWARMDHAWRARPDSRTVIKRAPSTYLSKFFFDTVTFDPEILRRLIDRFGADHVVLGTDYPYDMGEDDPLGLLAEVKRLPKADREQIVGGNAMKLLKIRR